MMKVRQRCLPQLRRLAMRCSVLGQVNAYGVVSIDILSIHIGGCCTKLSRNATFDGNPCRERWQKGISVVRLQEGVFLQHRGYIAVVNYAVISRRVFSETEVR